MNYTDFIHEQDRKTLEALKKIPAFPQLTKMFLKYFGEKVWHIRCMSSGIRLSPTQMGDLYALLPPICSFLQIEEPELYVVLDRDPNAYTIGVEKPIICLTSGLVELFSKEQIAVTLAHECGHILCQHNLYSTMAQVLFELSDSALSSHPLGQFVSLPLLLALESWSRSSELSADRVAAVYMGSAAPVAKLMGAFSGATEFLDSHLNFEEYLKQADEYEESIKSSSYNKLLEFCIYCNMDHPLNVKRAKEVLAFEKTEAFRRNKNNLLQG